MGFKKDDSCTIQKSSCSLINISTLNTFFIRVLDKGYHLNFIILFSFVLFVLQNIKKNVHKNISYVEIYRLTLTMKVYNI